MHLFQKQFTLIFLVLGLPLLFIPKVNLVAFDEQTAGLRLDDFILLGMSVVILWAHISIQKRLSTIEGGILAIFAISLFSFGMNRLLVAGGVLHVDAKVFYAFRLLEYFIFFYLGGMAVRYFRLGSLVIALLGWNVAWMLLQKLQIIGIFSVEGTCMMNASR